MNPKLAKNGTWYVEIGAKFLGGEVRPQRFYLGTKLEVAAPKAEELWALWLTQDGLWTDEGIKRGREIAWDRPRGKPKTWKFGRRVD